MGIRQTLVWSSLDNVEGCDPSKASIQENRPQNLLTEWAHTQAGTAIHFWIVQVLGYGPAPFGECRHVQSDLDSLCLTFRKELA